MAAQPLALTHVSNTTMATPGVAIAAHAVGMAVGPIAAPEPTRLDLGVRVAVQKQEVSDARKRLLKTIASKLTKRLSEGNELYNFTARFKGHLSKACFHGTVFSCHVHIIVMA